MFPDFQKTWVEKTPTMSFFPMVGVFFPRIHYFTTEKPESYSPVCVTFFREIRFQVFMAKKKYQLSGPVESPSNPCWKSLSDQLNCWKRNNPSFLNPTVSPEFSPPFGGQTPPEIYAFEQLAMRRGNAWKLHGVMGESQGSRPLGKKAWLRGFEASLLP